MAKVKFSRTEESDVSSIQIVDGQLIYTKTGKCYLDYGTERIEIVSGGDTLPIGAISAFGDVDEDNPLMSDWILCDGRELSRSTYSELFGVIGTKYGQGNGSTTFNVPKIDGRNLVGLDLTDEDFNEVGKTGGSKTHTQTINEMPNHTHGVIYSNTGGSGALARPDVTGSTTPTSSTGGGQPMNIMNPYIVVKFYIKAFRSASSTAQVKNAKTVSSDDVYSCNYVNNMRKVLWTNPNPSQEMGADVPINLSSSDYDELEWVFSYSNRANNAISVNCLKGMNITVITMGYNSPTLIRRVINYVSDTQYSTMNGKFGDADNATMLIPLSVIGIKNS